MDWEKGYSSSYYMTVVNPVTWQDIRTINITGGSINRECSGLRQSADVTCVDYEQGIEQWVRIYLETRQGGSSDRVALFTGLATSPDRDIKGAWEENNVECYSVLKPADDVILDRGWYAPVEMSADVILKQLMKPIPAPVEINENAPSLESAVIAEDGETNLTMLEKILVAIGWDLRIEGDGRIKIGPYSEDASAVFDPIEFDVIETEISVSADWYGCPNVFMAVSNDMTAVAKDESEDSPLSIQNRGREVWMYEGSCDLNRDETIAEYSMRRLKEEQRYAMSASYDRRFVPSVMPGDIVTLHYPKQGLDGDFFVESQSIELSYGARTSENLIGV